MAMDNVMERSMLGIGLRPALMARVIWEAWTPWIRGSEMMMVSVSLPLVNPK